MGLASPAPAGRPPASPRPQAPSPEQHHASPQLASPDPLTFKVFLPIAAAELLPSSGPRLLKDLLEPLHAQGAVEFILLLLSCKAGYRHGAQALRLWLQGRRGREDSWGVGVGGVPAHPLPA